MSCEHKAPEKLKGKLMVTVGSARQLTHEGLWVKGVVSAWTTASQVQNRAHKDQR